MALTVETGTGSATADSYVSLAEVRAYASSRGEVLGTDDTALEGQVRVAHDYLVQYESRFQGWRATAEQALGWPRKNVALFNRAVLATTIPQRLKDVVCQLVVELQARELQPVIEGRLATKESVGPISTEYQVTSALPSFPLVDSLLAPLLNFGSLPLQSIRV